jgi:hypothetical protein
VLCHAVTYRFRDSVGDAEVAELVARLGELPAEIDSIRSYRFGPDLGLTEGAGDFAVVAEFDDADGWRTYRDHPRHRELVELIGTMIEARYPVQFELPI